jgi:diaminopimelate epimerase
MPWYATRTPEPETRNPELPMRFTKMHGCGNDYIYVNGFEESVAAAPDVARRVSDRHFGIGGDGLILVLPSDVADVRMQMFNADGSEAEMCGNGIRCVAKFAYDRGLVDKTELDVETAAGIKRLDLILAGGRVSAARVNMGEPRLDRAAVPMLGPAGRVVDEPLGVDGVEFRVTAVSMGNPHCVIRVESVDEFPVAELGPRIERHPEFPERANVEFVEVCSETELRQRTWERGSGETLACGTGASAVAVAGVLNGWSRRQVTVHLIGGDLELDWTEAGPVYMTGPAVEVFRGETEM